ncbi:MAG TPA: hypothetical protein VGI40_10055 [Pirellulaceae bacterium]
MHRRDFFVLFRAAASGFVAQALCICLYFCLVLCLGCSAENPRGRKALSGRVTLNGAPLDQGNIEFHPLFEGGLQSGARITAGNYSIPAHEGVLLGKHRVAIEDFVPTPPMPAGYMPGDKLPPSPKAKVPPDWNNKSQHTIEVKQEGPFKFNFDIVTK